MTTRHRPILCESDFRRIESLLDDLTAVSIADARDIETLRTRIGEARVVADDAVPQSTVRLGCRFALIDDASGERDWFRLVAPNQADIAAGKLSVLAPMGTAILGCRPGVLVSVRVPSGTRKVRLDQVLHNELSTQRFNRLSASDDTVASA